MSPQNLGLTPNDHPIPGHSRSMLRWVMYAVLSLLRGIAWAGIFLWIAGWGGGSAAIPSDTALWFGAIAGVVVGSVMQYFYRKPDLMATVLSAPVAMWLGLCCFFFLSGAHHSIQHGGSPNFIGPMIMAVVGLFHPLGLMLMPLALANGLLLRWVLKGDHRPLAR